MTTVARGSISSISARRAAGSSSSAPDSETITGSSTTGVAGGSSSSARATASIVSRGPEHPDLDRVDADVLGHGATWARMISGGIACTAVTPTVFWAVIAVIAVIPCTPQAANAFRSAWMPAPPPESEPAIDSTHGGRRGTPRSVPAESEWVMGAS